MKIEMLKENKLKIMLEPDDLKRWGIDASNVLNNEPYSRNLFAEILKRAEKETGFSCVNSKLVVESRVNSEKKQLTLYVTKVATDKDMELFDEIYHENDLCIIPAEKVNSQNDDGIMVMLETLDDVLEVSNAFKSFCGCELFTYDKNYYITVQSNLENKISEFGKILSNCQRAIIEEHGNKIIGRNVFCVIREAFN
ncbi:MAG: adaptor protein MecA [Clostridia bacterium]|nr:adaptor protein MecA [Clostridia bacterium]